MTFDELIAPLDRARFLDEYWERQPTVIRGAADRFSHLFGTKDMGELLYYMRPRTPENLLVVKGGRPASTRWTDVDGLPLIKRVRDSWRDGHTVLVNRLERLWEPIGALKTTLQEDLHHRIDTDMYLTPPNSQGFAFHFDVMDVFILQVEGAKSWQVRESIQSLPLPDEHYDIAQDKLPPLVLEEQLTPGSVLYLPRGFVHAGRTTDQGSLHISVGVNVTTWLDLMRAALSHARRDDRFRRALPAAFFTQSPVLQSSFDHLAEVLPQHLKLAPALTELFDELNVKKQVPPGTQAFTIVPELHMQTVLQRRHGAVCRFDPRDDVAVLQFSGGRISAPVKLGPALRYVSEQRVLRITDLPGNLTDKEKLVLARRLVADDLLEVEQK